MFALLGVVVRTGLKENVCGGVTLSIACSDRISCVKLE